MTPASRGVLRLSLVLAFILGGISSLMSGRNPEFSLAVDIIGNWLVISLLAFVVIWLMLSLAAWAFRGFAK